MNGYYNNYRDFAPFTFVVVPAPCPGSRGSKSNALISVNFEAHYPYCRNRCRNRPWETRKTGKGVEGGAALCASRYLPQKQLDQLKNTKNTALPLVCLSLVFLRPKAFQTQRNLDCCKQNQTQINPSSSHPGLLQTKSNSNQPKQQPSWTVAIKSNSNQPKQQPSWTLIDEHLKGLEFFVGN